MIVAIASTKGGTGKTTTVCNIAACLGSAGYDVLAVDLDPQASLSRWYGLQEGATLADVLAGSTALTGAVYADEDFGFDLLPASRRLRGVEGQLASLERPLRRLVHEHYDVCVIDTPPSVSRFTSAAVEVSAGVVIPIEASMAAMDTLNDSLEVVRQIGGSVLGVLVCRVDPRTSNDVSVHPYLEEQYGELVFGTVIRESVAVRDSHAERIPTVARYADVNAAKDYKTFALELKARIDHAKKKAI